jgi:hypothetical protein
MAFPDDLDTFPDAATLAANTLATDPHSTLHGDLGAAVAALEAKVGVDSSAVATSHDYKIAALEAAGGGWVPSALVFSGADGCHVDHGFFWAEDTGTNLGNAFYWEAWVMPLGTGYVISDGYGGAHALLWGFTGSAGGPYTIVGNVWNGTTVGLTGLHPFKHGEWAHIAVGLSTGNLYQWVNGVGDVKTAFSGTRSTHTSGGGKLYVGGSDHLNGTFRLAAIRGWDRAQLVPNLNESFYPERAWYGNYSLTRLADFLVDYTTPGGIIADHSEGAVSFTGGGKIKHPGRRMGTGDAASAYLGGPQVFGAPQALLAWPTWVADADCPFGRQLGTTTASAGVTQTPPATPVGARIFDSFSRADQTLAFTVLPSLGSTEAGSLGPLVWQSATPTRPLFGILGGRAVFLGASGNLSAFGKPVWVENGAADMDVRVTRRLTVGSVVRTGIVFRLVDASNYWFATILEDGTGFIGSFTAGAEDPGVSTFATSAAHTHLRAVASGTTITIYTGDGTTWTQRAQRTGQTLHQAGTKAGMIATHAASYTGNIGFGRWDDFTVI